MGLTGQQTSYPIRKAWKLKILCVRFCYQWTEIKISEVVIRCWVCGRNVSSHFYLCPNNCKDVHFISLSRTVTRCVDELALPEQRIRNQRELHSLTHCPWPFTEHGCESYSRSFLPLCEGLILNSTQLGDDLIFSHKIILLLEMTFFRIQKILYCSSSFD